MPTEWVDGVLRDGMRRERVHAHLGPHWASETDDGSVAGVFDPSPGLAVGKAVHLDLDDGRGALVVVVNEVGRFLSVGPLV